VTRRIARRMKLAKIGSLEEYVQFLKQSPVEAEALANDIFIHVTGFLRDPECFQALRKQLFRDLRKRSTEVLQQSASTLHALIDSSPQAILAVSDDGKIMQANAVTEKLFGYRLSELLGQPIEMLIPENLRDLHAGLRKEFFVDPRSGPVGITREIEGRRKDATQIQIEITLGYIDTLEGKLAAAFVTDITHRKKLERISETSRQKISALAASLLRVQEKERRRVSRELHDTLCQQLASLAFDVGDLAAQTSPSDVAHSHLRKIQARVVKMSEEVRHIGYQLHPSELDDLGLNAALQTLCDEVSKRHRITIKVASNDVSEQLPLEVASCLYRVCQEGLNNMVKHSKAKRASVTLIEEHGSIALSIKDDGVGFRVDTAEGNGGLGIIGMKERARIVNGKLSIKTATGKGTKIDLVVPLTSTV
jgi:PAS domain S-box-containing protein